MILVDTNVVVALADDTDDLHDGATSGLRRLRRSRFGVTAAVLAECLHLLRDGHQRRRLAGLFDKLGFEHVALEPPWWADLFAWLDDYADHRPDLADAQLVVLCAREPAHRVWTYDREFKDIWRLPNGKRVPLVAEGTA